VRTPELCALGTEEEPPVVNAWFGPAGTVTPLHHDPKHNLLVQVVGRKFVRLFAPEHSAALYPHSEAMLCNSSQVDVRCPDHARFPAFGAAPFMDAELGPGDALFIPRGWWHYVVALTSSFSVSHWWT